MTNHPNWYLSKIKQFLNIGFFDGVDEKDIESIAQRVIEESDKSYFGNILHLQNAQFLEQILVSYDKKRVWWVEDWMTYGASQENEHHFYLDVLDHLSDIASGSFNPKNSKIEECGYCDGRDKRITISFQLDEKKLNVNFCIDGTVLILNFLEEINEILEPKGYSFEYIFDVYGLGFIFCLTKNQKEFLLRKLNWKFNENSGYWLDKAQFQRDVPDNVNAEKYFEKAIENADHETYPFAISEYGRFLEDQGKHNRAIEIIEKGVHHFKQLEDLNEQQKWWFSALEDDLVRLHKCGYD